MVHPLEPRLAAYIATRMPDAADIAVDRLERISGGASRETYRFRLAWREGGEARQRQLILRRDPPASLIDTERRVEFEAYRAFAGSAVPVPEMLWLEEASEALDHPFFIAEELTGHQAAPQMLFSGAYDAVLPKVAERKWTILGEIARADPLALGLDRWMPAPALDDAWRRELAHWEAILDKDQAEPLPIARAAIRWLKANPPPPARKLAVVHGDYRTGNFLYDAAGEIHGVLDWEMPTWAIRWKTSRGASIGLAVRPAGAGGRARRPGAGRRHLGARQRAQGRSCRAALVDAVQLREGPGDLGGLGPRLHRRRQPRADHGLSGLVAAERPGPGDPQGDGQAMTPSVPSVLSELANLLTRNAAPGVPDAERASALGLSALLLNLSAEVWDGAAHNLVTENRALRDLLDLPGEDGDLRLSALRAENDRLRPGSSTPRSPPRPRATWRARTPSGRSCGPRPSGAGFPSHWSENLHRR